MNYEEQPARGISAGKFVVGAAVLCLLAVLLGALRPDSALMWMVLAVMAVPAGVCYGVVRRMKPAVLARRWGTDPIERGYEVPLLGAAALFAVATCAVSAVDYFHLHMGYMGGWWAPVGLVLTSMGTIMYQQTLLACAPHDRSRYGELPGENAVKGAYGDVRHPLCGLFLVALLGVPLMLSSWLGLIGWALAALTVMIYVSKEDKWRFENYEWYYEYTTQARKKMIPMIW